MKFWWLMMLFLLFALLGCTLDDRDRCLDGYEWDEDDLFCRVE